MALRRSIRITKVNVSELIRHQSGVADEVENAFTELQARMTIATESGRKAEEAEAGAAIIRAEASIAQAAAQKAFLAFLRLSSGYSNLIATERNWLPPFRNADGEICIENPFTLRDQRNAARAMHQQIARQANTGDGDEPDIFEEDGEGNE